MSEPPHRVHHITESRVVEIVTAMIDKKSAEYDDQIRTVISASVRETLIQLGVDTSDPVKMQRDFAHLRDWRQTIELLQSKTTATLLGLLIAGIVALMLAGFRGLMRGG